MLSVMEEPQLPSFHRKEEETLSKVSKENNLERFEWLRCSRTHFGYLGTFWFGKGRLLFFRETHKKKRQKKKIDLFGCSLFLFQNSNRLHSSTFFRIESRNFKAKFSSTARSAPKSLARSPPSFNKTTF